MKNEVEQPVSPKAGAPVVEPAVEEKSLVLPIVITALVTAVVFSGIFALIFVFGFNDSTPVENGLSVKTYQSVAKSNCQKTGGNFDMDSGCNCGEGELEEDTGFCVLDSGLFGGEFGELQKALAEAGGAKKDLEEEADEEVSGGVDQAMRIVSNQNGAYSFELPLSWGVIMPEGKYRGMNSNFDPQKEPKKWAGAISVYGKPDGSFDQFVKEYYSSLTIKNQTDITVDGLKGVLVEYEYGTTAGSVALAISGNNLYEIKLDRINNATKVDFDSILKSFKITGTPVLQ